VELPQAKRFREVWRQAEARRSACQARPRAFQLRQVHPAAGCQPRALPAELAEERSSGFQF
jgi:hypothetical protein